MTKFHQFGGLVLTIAFGRSSCIFIGGDTLLNPGTGVIMQACVALRKQQQQQQADNY